MEDIATSQSRDMNEILWDVKSQLSLPHFTFILNQFLPIRHCKQEDVEKTEAQVMDVYQKTYGDTTDMKVILTGSSFEGLFIPPYFFFDQSGKESNIFEASDVDAMIELCHKIIGDRKTDSEVNLESSPDLHSLIETNKYGIHPGYLRLRLIKPELTASEYKSPVPNESGFYLLSNAITSAGIEDLIQRISINDPSFLRDHIFENHGPAFTYFSTTKSKVERTRETDNVVALPCHSWPTAASEWSSRHRPTNWPSPSLVTEITKHGCHVVPVAHKNSNWKEAEWRFSFSVAEKILVKSLNDVQRHCYKIMKILHKFCLQEPKVICSYHLKMILLWSCENAVHITWREDNLAECLFYLLDELSKSLSSRKLSHYFIKENNLLDHIDEETMQIFSKLFDDMRSFPLKYLFAFNNKYKFGFSPLCLPLEVILEPMVQEIKNLTMSTSKENISNLKIRCFENLACVHRKEKRFAEIIEVWCQIFNENIKKGSIPKEIPLIDYLVFRMNKVSDESFDEMCMIADQIFKTYQVPGPLISNHACLLFSHACNKDIGQEREKLIEKARTAFNEAIKTARSTNVCLPAMWTDYSNFLCKLERYSEAVGYLNDVIQQEEHSTKPKGQNCYNKNDVNAVTDQLANEIEAYNKPLIVSSVAYSFYLLIHANVKLGNASENDQLIKRFQSFCKNLTSVDLSSLCLLGYSFMNGEDYSSALEVFDEVLTLNADHPTAATNKEECQAYIMSLQLPE